MAAPHGPRARRRSRGSQLALPGRARRSSSESVKAIAAVLAYLYGRVTGSEAPHLGRLGESQITICRRRPHVALCYSSPYPRLTCLTRPTRPYPPYSTCYAVCEWRRLTFLGAARTVTGSKYLLEVDGTSASSSTADSSRASRSCVAATGRRFPIHPAALDAVLLTHAHIDHSGLLPRLVANGFHGRIYLHGGHRGPVFARAARRRPAAGRGRASRQPAALLTPHAGAAALHRSRRAARR